MIPVLTSGCSLIAQPEIRDVRASVKDIDLEGITLVFDVDVYNPYALDIHTPEFRYGLDISDKEFIKAEETTEVNLPALDVGTLHMPAHIKYLGLWQAYQELTGEDEVKYRLHGTVLVKTLEQTFELPVSYRGAFPVFRLPSFSMPEVSFSDVSLTGAKAVIQTDISNPNVFEIGLKGLSLDIQIGDVQVGSIRALSLDSLDARASSKLAIVGEVTALNALTQVLGGKSLGKPTIKCFGTVETPYGVVPLEKR
jgi:LEA14-like dessication related protein